jgi:hypothetical protein
MEIVCESFLLIKRRFSIVISLLIVEELKVKKKGCVLYNKTRMKNKKIENCEEQVKKQHCFQSQKSNEARRILVKILSLFRFNN